MGQIRFCIADRPGPCHWPWSLVARAPSGWIQHSHCRHLNSVSGREPKPCLTPLQAEAIQDQRETSRPKSCYPKKLEDEMWKEIWDPLSHQASLSFLQVMNKGSRGCAMQSFCPQLTSHQISRRQPLPDMRCGLLFSSLAVITLKASETLLSSAASFLKTNQSITNGAQHIERVMAIAPKFLFKLFLI